MKHRELPVGTGLSPTDLIEVEQITLRKIKMRSSVRIADHIVANTEYSIAKDLMSQSLIMHMETAVLGHRVHNPTISVSYPATWWQHFKQRWFPAWAKRKWPIETKEESATYDIEAAYPDFEFHLPEDRHYLTIHKTSGW